MAGTYPDVPARRFSHDRDGSVGAFVTSGGGITALTGAEMVTINNESSDFVHMAPATTSLAVIFPELRDIGGYAAVYSSTDGSSPSTVYTSVDTTNGFDGTWVSRGTFVNTTIGAGLRTVQSVSWSGIKAVRFHGTGGTFGGSNDFSAVHLFGSLASGENPDRLQFWQDPTDAEVTGPYFDLGDVIRGATNIVAFRIKNNSSTLTANSIGISIEALTDASPTAAAQHTFSTDGVSYFGTINIGNLAPGALSGTLYVKRATSPSAVAGLWWSRFVATAASWT
jgi:hypothetical protein